MDNKARIKNKVLAVLARMRPYLQADGGDVSLISISDDGVVEVALKGACHGCPMSMITLKGGIERFLRQAVPGVKEVIAAG